MAIDLSGLHHKKTTIIIGTEKYTFTELTLADIAEFRSHLKTERQQANEKRRQRLIADAELIGNVDPMELLKLTDTSMTEEEFELQMGTLEGIAHLAYLSLRHCHPGISLKNTSEIITPANIEQITEAMFPALPDELLKKKPSQTRKKKQSRKS